MIGENEKIEAIDCESFNYDEIVIMKYIILKFLCNYALFKCSIAMRMH